MYQRVVCALLHQLQYHLDVVLRLVGEGEWGGEAMAWVIWLVKSASLETSDSEPSAMLSLTSVSCASVVQRICLRADPAEGLLPAEQGVLGGGIDWSVAGKGSNLERLDPCWNGGVEDGVAWGW